MEANVNLDKFYAWSLITLGIFVAFILIAIWVKIHKAQTSESKEDKKVYDYGLLWLSCAILFWVLSGIWILAKGLDPSALRDSIYIGVKSYISTFNNAFFLLSLPYFDHGPEKLNLIQNDKRWTQTIIIISFFICAVTTMLVIFDHSRRFILLPEGIYAIITILAIGIALIKTFYHRGFKIIIIFTCISIVIMIITQILEVKIAFSNEPTQDPGWILKYLHLISKVSIMTILLALAMSWVEVEAKRPKSTEMSINVIGIKGNKGSVQITVPPDLVDHYAEFNRAPFEYLLKFLVRRITGEDTVNAWLSIKDDLFDSTNIRRILNEFKSKDTQLLRTELFDNDRRGNYRIRIAPDNIEINIENLLQFPQFHGLLNELRSHSRFKERFKNK